MTLGRYSQLIELLILLPNATMQYMKGYYKMFVTNV